MIKNINLLITNLHELSQAENLHLEIFLAKTSEKIFIFKKESEEIFDKILNCVLDHVIGGNSSKIYLNKKGSTRELSLPAGLLNDVKGLERHIEDAVKVILRGRTSLSDKMGSVKAGSNEKVIVKAARDYEKWCLDNGIQPHRSKVHTFADTMQQARILTLSAKDLEEVYKMASLTYFGHLYDDIVDSDKDLSNQFSQIPRSFEELKRKSNKTLKKVLVKSLSLGSNESERKKILTTLLDVVDGALIQQAGSYQEQKKYAEGFKHQVLSSIRNPELRSDLEKMHPMQIALISHVDLDGWFGLEKGNSNEDLAKLWSLWAAPALYCHDRKEEIEKEGFRLRYGKKLDGSHNGFIDNSYLKQMINTAEKYLVKIPDPRKLEHLKELETAYQAFRGTIPKEVRRRYEQSLAKLNTITR